MKTKGLFLFLLVYLLSSCSMPGGVSVGSGGQGSISFDKVALKYDFSKKCNIHQIAADYAEFRIYHNYIPDPNIPLNDPRMDPQKPEYYVGSINYLQDILFMVDAAPEGRKPSITLTMYGERDSVVTKKFSKDEVFSNTLENIPSLQPVYTGTVEVKSYKTSQYGLQVVWKKSASGPDWPFHEFVKDGTLSAGTPGIVKGGTNNGNGNIAGRDGGFLDNTGHLYLHYYYDPSGDYHIVGSEDGSVQLVIEEEPFYSPDLCEEVYVGGEFSNEVEWDKPVIYRKK